MRVIVATTETTTLLTKQSAKNLHTSDQMGTNIIKTVTDGAISTTSSTNLYATKHNKTIIQTGTARPRRY